MEIILIAGIAQNNVIGNKGMLPWNIKEDLQHFKELTTGHPVIMGRVTYLSILEYLNKPLPNRTNIVLSDKVEDKKPGFIFANSIESALEEAKKYSDKVYIMGGQSIYKQFMPLATKLEITKIHKNYEGDAFFPEINESDWLEKKREDKESSENKFSFITYERKPQALTPVKKGMFIAFEGIDGCGKSTQVRNLVHHIFEKSKYHHVVLTRNPYKNVSIREILHQDTDPYSQAEKLAELYINDRKDQVEEVVKPNLKDGFFVVTDRYKMSTISYQTAQGLEMQNLIEKQSSLPIPHITFIIDVSPEEAMDRMRKEDVSVRGKEHKFEANIDFIKKLRENYKIASEILKENGEKVFVINGERSKEEIFQEIKEIFDRETQN